MDRRSVKLWVSCFVLSLILSLGLLEVLIRISGRAAHLYTEPAFELAPGKNYWRYRAGFEGKVLGATRVRIGSLGSRLHARYADAAPAQITVGIFGDSVTFGQGVPDDLTYAARLEKWLRESQIPVTVLNFGVQGHTIDMELAHLSDRLTQTRLDVVVLAFLSNDLNLAREQNHVDRFGYLTKNMFGPPSFVGDLGRAVLRKSHLALLTKAVILRVKALRKTGEALPSDRGDELEPKLRRFRSAMARFERIAKGIPTIVICVDIRENIMSRRIQDIMTLEFPHLIYLHAPPELEQFSRAELEVKYDSHPNATAHQTYANLLWPALVDVVQSIAVNRVKASGRASTTEVYQ
jgi:hypothetical protein